MVFPATKASAEEQSVSAVGRADSIWGRSRSIQSAGTYADGPLRRSRRRSRRVLGLRRLLRLRRHVFRRGLAGLEGFEDRAAALPACAGAGGGIDADQLDAGGHAKRRRRLVLERQLHEVAEHRRSILAGRRRVAEGLRLVVT